MKDEMNSKRNDNQDKNTHKNNDEIHTNHEYKNLGKRIIISIVVILIILATCLILLGRHYLKTSFKPLNPNETQKVQVNIPMGASSRKIGSILQTNNIVRNGLVFDYYIKTHNMNDFRAGYYQLSPSMSLDQIAQSLKKGGMDRPIESQPQRIVISSGSNVEQISNEIGKYTKYSANDFNKLMHDKEFIHELTKKYPQLLSSSIDNNQIRYPLEGYLYPDIYYYDNNTPLQKLVEEMVVKSNQVMRPYYKTIKKKQMNVHQVLTLSSLIEKENVHPNDRSIIAGILFNRLNNQIPIQSNQSLFYALRKNDKVLKNKDFVTKSPYNLYYYGGIGPGPISNVDINTVKSVLSPRKQKLGFLYFVVNKDDKKVYYANNVWQKDALISQYINHDK